MKRLILLGSVALLALAACSKVSVVENDAQQIGFQVAKYVNTKAVYTGEYFGSYAWFSSDDPFEGSQNAAFFSNEQVGIDETLGKWTTINKPYFWPKAGRLDFISYSPYAAEGGPSVSQSRTVNDETGDETFNANISWDDRTIALDNDDLMYADRQYSEYYESCGKTGVPTLFHHALAQLGFQVMVNFDSYGENTWEVRITDASLRNVATTGSLSMDITDQFESGWPLPEVLNADKEGPFAVWTLAKDPKPQEVALYKEEAAASTDDSTTPATPKGLLLKTDPQPLFGSDEEGNPEFFFVIPQILEGTQQVLHLEFTIKTTLPTGLVINESFEGEKALNVPMKKFSDAWEMNQRFLYTIMICPIDYNEDPDDPSKAKITFDPAVVDWTVVTPDVIIEL